MENTTNQPAQKPEETTEINKPEKTDKKKNKTTGKDIARIIVTILLIVVGIFLVLFVLRVAAKYDSIAEMLQDMWRSVTDMFKYGLR